MRQYVLVGSVLCLATGLVFGMISRKYRTPKTLALPWYRTILSWNQITEYYTSPGPTLTHLSSSLMGIGAVLLLISLWLQLFCQLRGRSPVASTTYCYRNTLESVFAVGLYAQPLVSGGGSGWLAAKFFVVFRDSAGIGTTRSMRNGGGSCHCRHF